LNEGLGSTVPPLQALDMLDVSLSADCKASCLNATNAKLHSVLTHDLGSAVLEVNNELGQFKDSVRHGSLEFRFSRKDYCRVNTFLGQKLQEVLYRPYMKQVLKDRILKV
jgi:hypothetical protein